jgi:2-desacetyl-2-hydroxyethyl bacteriochlorophyllide A dehydrogenase
VAVAVWFQGPRRVGLADVPVRDPGDGEVLVRTALSGISAGTELLAYRGQLDPDMVLDEALAGFGGTFAYPFRYGYSCAGRVERTRAAGVAEGDRVFAFHPHQDSFVVPADDVVVVPGGLSDHVVTMYPLVETALQIALDAGDVRYQPVAVLGLGAVGLLTARLLQEAGAVVLPADPLPWRRRAAGDLGLAAVDPSDLGDRVAGETGGRGVPLVVEASGNPEALAGALGLLAHEGTALVASWYGTRMANLPLGGAFHRRRLVIRSTQVSTIPARLAARWDRERRRRTARALMDALPLHRLATHEWPAAEAANAFAALDRGEEGLLHAALRWE